MVLFPNRLGLPLAGSSAVNMLYEFVFYGIIFFLFRHSITLPALMVGAAMTLVYRMAIGAVFGLMLIIMYGLNSNVAFSLGMTKYLPAVLLHVAAAPFILRPVYLQLAQQMTPDRNVSARNKDPQIHFAASEKNSFTPIKPAAKQEMKVTGHRSLADTSGSQAVPSGPAPVSMIDESPFDRAINYIGESGAVQMVVLVDEEGLLIANFNRSNEDLELWAPLAVVLRQTTRSMLNDFGKRELLEKIDLGTSNYRIILRRIEHLMLMILADKDIDETIHIRIAQATDMIRKYMNERYSPAIFVRVEEQYVSNS